MTGLKFNGSDEWISYRHARESIQLYLDHGCEPGGQLRAMLENDLRETFRRADDVRARIVFQILQYLWNDVPAMAWGSKEKVREWMDMDGHDRRSLLAERERLVRGLVGDRDEKET